jgi:hypothetical protein
MAQGQEVRGAGSNANTPTRVGKINLADDTTGQRRFAIDTYTDFEANPEGSIRSTYDSGSMKVRRKGDQTT